MDPAQEVILQVLKRQNAMNAVIDRFDSPVQQFYRGATVLVTGGSGFLGKQLIEKLFRSCEIKKLYMLLRSRKERTIEGRLQTILKDRVFDSLREKQPSFADRIVAVEGDVTDIRLGLSDDHWTKLTQEVDTIFHGAATVRFDAPLRSATLTNVRGTREVITLARACPNLRSLVHVSTAYTHATKDLVGKEVLEQFYETPISPDLMIAIAEELDEKKLDEMTESMITVWPNTYTFTKAVAEELVRTATDLPLSVVRPPIVINSYSEPSPGWLDMNAINGASGIILGTVLGILRVFYVDAPSTYLPLTPVDYVNNCVIAAGWDAAEQRKGGEKDIPVYTVSNAEKFVLWSHLSKVLHRSISNCSSPKAVWRTGLYEVNNKILYFILSWLLHYIPAYIADVVCYVIGKKPKGIKSFVSVYKKVDTFAAIFHYFLSNTWMFKDDNVKAMCKRMNEADRAIYNCDIVLCVLLGILQVVYVNRDCLLPVTPVDYVNNSVIAAGWDAAEKRKRGEDIPVYTVSNKDKYLEWKRIANICRGNMDRYASPKAVWYCEVVEVHNKFVYIILSWLLHYIPAYIADAVLYIIGKKIEGVKSIVAVYNKLDTFADIFHYFLFNEWTFKDDNVKAMCKRMNEADRAIYNCDVSNIDLNELCLVWGMGIRKFIIKDGLEGSVEGSKKQEKLKILHYVFWTLYFYCIFKILSFFYQCMSIFELISIA